MKVSVIISTYNQPRWLEKTLWGYDQQSFKDFEVVIADDGSGQETAGVIEKAQNDYSFPITRVWHEDNGFQKSAILNKAILETNHDYLIFTDGDCIPRHNFIQTHVDQSEENCFLSGGYCKLPIELSRFISQKDVVSGDVFTTSWLLENGSISFSSRLKIGLKSPFNKLADKITTTKPTWNGCNSSTWKKYILKVNGHDEAMQYGGQDREMGERLTNSGLKAKQIRHQAILLHLDHSRGYKNQESIDKNLMMRNQTKESGSAYTENGIEKVRLVDQLSDQR